MKEIFDFEEFFKRMDDTSKPEERLIEKHCKPVLDDYFDDWEYSFSTPEAQNYYYMFKAGWILSQMAGE